jgi:organic hydroperoxide reductase OsmC/OhrA
VSAAASCFSATFFAAAAGAGLRIGGFECHAKAILDRTPEGVRFTSIHLALDVRVTSDEIELTRRLLEDAKRHCFVANTLRCPVSVSADVKAS